MTLLDLIRPGAQPERRRSVNRLRLQNVSGITAHPPLYEQEHFLHLLYLEQRRSERSTRPLCLILLSAINVHDNVIRTHIFRQLFQALRTRVRETDIIGWYQQNTTLAVIFPDVTAAKAVIADLRSKVNYAVSTALPPELAGCVNITVHIFPRHHDVNAGMGDLTLYPDVPFQSNFRKSEHLLKRGMDVIASFILLCLLAPLFALIALVIKLNSKGPVFFRQVRVGHQGKPFRFWKFRSMYVDSDATIHKEFVTKFISHGQAATHNKLVYKITNDPRVTPTGRFLRKTSLDELPQLWNVLRGDMSLVGPRPALPYELECYAPWHRRRLLEVKPGITGLWQVTGRSRTSFNDMVRLDLRYVQQWSIWLDLKILLQTPKAVLTGEGAY